MSFKKDVSAYVKSGESEEERLGLELEHFVVNDRGEQIQFDVISSLIGEVGKSIGAEITYTDGYPVGYVTKEYSVSLEPACQFEIGINPYSELSAIEDIYTDFLRTWEPVFSKIGYRLVTKGNLPLVELGKITPDDIPLSPKKRYQYMDAYLRKSGKYGNYMMRASASTQISFDYKSEGDMVKKLRVLQKISPVLMLIMENKTDENTTLPGEEDKPHLLRIQEWDDLDPARTGFYPNSFDEDFGYEKISDVVCHTPLILLTDDGITSDVGHKNAEELLSEHILTEEELDESRRIRLTEHFISMAFYHFRIKKYIEIRIADSVPINRALGYAALLKGIVYSNRNLDILDEELSEIDESDKIQDAVVKIETDGSDAVIYRGRTAAQWKTQLVQLAKDEIPEHEKEYLAYV